MDANPASFPDHIRAETRAAHRAIDHHPLLAPLVRDGLTARIYGDALAALYAPLQVLEEWVVPLATLERGWVSYQSRLSLLAADLAVLERTPIPMRIEQVPVIGIPERFGLLYVLEGSRLGGAMIGRQLAKSQLAKNMYSGVPQHFFADHQSVEHWQSFWVALTAQQFSEAELERVVAGAHAGFSVYLNHLNDCLRER
jgi:heme oxygenase